MPTTPRAQLRQAAKAALQAAVTAQNFVAGIQSPGDWNNPPASLPAIQLRAPDDHKQSGAKSQPNFTVMVTLELQIFAAGTATAEDAQDAIELLDAWVEQTLFTYEPLLALLQQVVSVETSTTISADGKQHFAAAEKRIVLETFEDFEPTITTGLERITVTLDTQKPYDPTGTYTPSPDAPPYTPVPEPRTVGPDGRVEGAIDITLPQ